MKPRLAAVFLAKNESASIVQVLTEVQQWAQQSNFSVPHIFVVDDSTDNTAKLAEQNGAEVLSGGNKGLGYAYWIGCQRAAACEIDLICVLDADGQTHINEIGEFVDPIVSGKADLVVGSRFLKPQLIHYKYPIFNRIGTILLSIYLTLVTRQRFTDSHGGLRVMKKAVAKSLEIWGTHTYVQEAIIDAVAKGFRVHEIPSQWSERKTGESRVVRSVFRYVRKTAPVLFSRALWMCFAKPMKEKDVA